MMAPTWTLCSALLVATVLAAGPASARIHEPSSVATSLARAEPNKCLADLWWGLKDSYSLIVDTTKGCIGEKLDDWKFLWEDVKDFARRAGAELKEAGQKCLQKPQSCPAQLAQVAKRELQPLADLLWRTVKALITVGFSATFELFGCIFLPAILPAVWQTLMDLLIFGQCLVTKA